MWVLTSNGGESGGGYEPAFCGFVSSGGGGSSGPWQSRDAVLKILDGKNPCADWFATGTGSAHNIMSTTEIKLGGESSTGPVAGPDADTPQGPNGAITVYSDGRFYPNSTSGIPVGAICNRVTGNCTGGYRPGSYGAQMILLLHELAHKVLLVPPENLGDTKQSDANTQTVMQHCASSVGAQLQ